MNNKEVLIDIPKSEDEGWYRLVVYTDGTYLIDKEREEFHNMTFKWAIGTNKRAIFYEGDEPIDNEFLGVGWQRELVYKAWKQLQDDVDNILIYSTESTENHNERNILEQ